MNPYQVIGVIAASMLVFAGFVAVLALMGMPLLVAFLTVYLITLWFMVGMQKRARQYCVYREQRRILGFGTSQAQADMPESCDSYQDFEGGAAERSERATKMDPVSGHRTGFQASHTHHLASALKNL